MKNTHTAFTQIKPIFNILPHFLYHWYYSSKYVAL